MYRRINFKNFRYRKEPGRLYTSPARNNDEPCLFMEAIHHLKERGLVNQSTDLPAMAAQYRLSPFKAYAGVDPTAASLHLGHLIPFFLLTHLRRAGVDIIALIGGATAVIGDPTGKSQARSILTTKSVGDNAAAISQQVQVVLERSLEAASRHLGDKKSAKPGRLTVLNNSEWLGKVNFLEFLSNTGRHVRLGKMLARESVSKRLDSGVGMSFLEFCYPLMQAYDFNRLCIDHSVRLQVGGSDQWGNICEGIDLIDKIHGKHQFANGITTPLLLDERGNKFGKSEGNALWIDSALVSPFSLYQTLLKTPDSLIGSMLRMLTFLPVQTIDRMVSNNSSERPGQHALAKELLELLHGKHAYDTARSLAMSIFYPQSGPLDSQELLKGFRNDAEFFHILHKTEQQSSKTLSDLCRAVGWADDRVAEGMSTKAVKVNRQRCKDRAISDEDWIDGKVMVLQMGNSHLAIIERTE